MNKDSSLFGPYFFIFYISLQCLATARQSVAHFLQSGISNLSHSLAHFSHTFAHSSHLLLQSLLLAFMAVTASVQAVTHSLQSFSHSAILGFFSFAHMASTFLQDAIHTLHASMQALCLSENNSDFSLLLTFSSENSFVVAEVIMKPMATSTKVSFFIAY